jgi:hypothetical protein
LARSYALQRWIVRRPLAAVLLLLALAAACAAGLPRLRFSNDIEVFFGKDDPKLADLRDLEDAFGDSQSILFVVAPDDGNVFTPAALALLADLTGRAWKLPYARRVDSIVNFQHTYALGDDLVVEDLVGDPNGLDAEGIARVREIALGEPLLVNRLISPGGHVAGVNVPLQLPNERPLEETPEAASAARELARRVMADHPGVQVKLSGLILMNTAVAEVGAGDIARLMPIMLGVILVLLGVLLRSAWATLATLVVILLSIVVALGLTGWLGVQLSPPVVSAANMIMTLAIADCVHILTTFFGFARQGRPKREAVLETMRLNWRAVAVTSFTTVVGFLTMNTSESPPFRDLGNIVAIGVFAAWVFAAYLLPPLILLLPMRPRATRGEGTGPGALAGLGESVIARRTPVLIVATVIAVGLALFIPRNQLDDEFLKYFDTSVKFRQEADFAIENLTGLEYIEYKFSAGEADGISDPDYLHALDRFAAWYREQPKVRHVAAYTDVVKRLNRNLHDDDPAFYRVPDDRGSAAQYLLLYEMSLPFGLDLTDQISIDRSATLLRVSLDSITSNEMMELERRGQEWLDANAPRYRHNPAAGQSLIFAHIGRRNIVSLLQSSVAALFVISLLLIFMFRSLKFGLLSLIPNLAPAAMAYGLWGIFVGRVGLALSVVVGMTLGIVVDDTIHFFNKYLHARRQEGRTPEDAVRYAFRETGAAMCITSGILIAGFCILMASDFELNSGMGLLSAITIGIALLADLFMTPAILLLVDRQPKGAHR